MKILHVLLTPRAEGTPRLVLDWLTVDGHDQRVLFLNEQPDDLLGRFPREQVFINKSLKSGIGKIIQIYKIIKGVDAQFHPDLIISWSTGMSAWVLLAAKACGIKRLVTHVGNSPGDSKRIQDHYWAYLTFYTNLLLGAKAVCCSKFIKQQYQTIPLMPRKIFYDVYNCANISSFKTEDRNFNIFTCVMVATLERHKDHWTLLKAWQLVEQKRADLQLKIVGNGSLRNELELFSLELQLKNVVFMGTRNDVKDILQDSSVFIFSTTPNEGFGIVLIEALAAGLRVIASDVPACDEVLCSGAYGKLFTYKDYEALAVLICSEIERRNSIVELDAIKKYLQNFAPEVMLQKYIETTN